MFQERPQPASARSARTANADVGVGGGGAGDGVVVDPQVLFERALEVAPGVGLVPHLEVPVVDRVAPLLSAVRHHLLADPLPLAVASVVLWRERVLPPSTTIARRDLSRHAFEHDDRPEAVLDHNADACVERVPREDRGTSGVFRVHPRVVHAVVHPQIAEAKPMGVAHGVDRSRRDNPVHMPHITANPEVAERTQVLGEVDGHRRLLEIQRLPAQHARVVQQL